MASGKYEPKRPSGKYEAGQDTSPGRIKLSWGVAIVCALGLAWAMLTQPKKLETAPEKHVVDCTGMSELACLQAREIQQRKMEAAVQWQQYEKSLPDYRRD